MSTSPSPLIMRKATALAACSEPTESGAALRSVVQRTLASSTAPFLGADVCGLGEPPSPTCARGTQLGGADQSRYRRDPLPSAYYPTRRVIEEFGHRLILACGRRDVPRATLPVFDKSISEGDVCFAAFLMGGHRHDRRPGQRVPERDPGRRVVHVHQLSSLRRSQIGHAGPVGQSSTEHAGVTSTLEGGEQQHLFGCFGQGGEACREDRLQAIAEEHHPGWLPRCHAEPSRAEGSSIKARGLPCARLSRRYRTRACICG